MSNLVLYFSLIALIAPFFSFRQFAIAFSSSLSISKNLFTFTSVSLNRLSLSQNTLLLLLLHLGLNRYKIHCQRTRVNEIAVTSFKDSRKQTNHSLSVAFDGTWLSSTDDICLKHSLQNHSAKAEQLVTLLSLLLVWNFHKATLKYEGMYYN